MSEPAHAAHILTLGGKKIDASALSDYELLNLGRRALIRLLTADEEYKAIVKYSDERSSSGRESET